MGCGIARPETPKAPSDQCAHCGEQCDDCKFYLGDRYCEECYLGLTKARRRTTVHFQSRLEDARTAGSDVLFKEKELEVGDLNPRREEQLFQRASMYGRAPIDIGE